MHIVVALHKHVLVVLTERYVRLVGSAHFLPVRVRKRSFLGLVLGDSGRHRVNF